MERDEIDNYVREVTKEVINEMNGLSNFIDSLNSSFKKIREKHLSNINSNLTYEDKAKAFEIVLNLFLSNHFSEKNKNMLDETNNILEKNIPIDDRDLMNENKKYLENNTYIGKSVYSDININRKDRIPNNFCPLCIQKVLDDDLCWTCSYCSCTIHFYCGNKWFSNNRKCYCCKNTRNFLILNIVDKKDHALKLELTIKYCAIQYYEKERDNFVNRFGNLSFIKNFSKDFAYEFGISSLHIDVNENDKSANVSLVLGGESYLNYNFKPFKKDRSEFTKLLKSISNTPFMTLINLVVNNRA